MTTGSGTAAAVSALVAVVAVIVVVVTFSPYVVKLSSLLTTDPLLRLACATKRNLVPEYSRLITNQTRTTMTAECESLPFSNEKFNT